MSCLNLYFDQLFLILKLFLSVLLLLSLEDRSPKKSWTTPRSCMLFEFYGEYPFPAPTELNWAPPKNPPRRLLTVGHNYAPLNSLPGAA